MNRLGAAALLLLCSMGLAAQAPAEHWAWFPITGGAVAYDEKSLYVDVGTGLTGVNTVTYYQTPRLGPTGGVYSYLAERLEFECRGNRYRWSKSVVLDRTGHLVSEREDGAWTEMGAALGAPALYRRMLCNADKPPALYYANTIEALYTAMTDPAPRPAPVAAAPAAAPIAPPPVVPAAAPKAVQAPAAAPKAAEPKATPQSLDLNALAASLAQPKGQPATAPSPSPEPKLRP